MLFFDHTERSSYLELLDEDLVYLARLLGGECLARLGGGGDLRRGGGGPPKGDLRLKRGGGGERPHLRRTGIDGGGDRRFLPPLDTLGKSTGAHVTSCPSI